MAKTIGTDVETFRRAVAFEHVALGRPKIEDALSVAELRDLVEGDPAARSKLAKALVKRELWEQDAPSEFLSANSYGYAIQHKSRERLYKLAALEQLGGQVDANLRSSTDAELLGLLAAVGLTPTGS